MCSLEWSYNLLTKWDILENETGAINSYTRITGVKQEYPRQTRMCGPPRKYLPLLLQVRGSASRMVVLCSFPEHVPVKKVYFPDRIKASFSKLPGIPGTEEETNTGTTKMWAGPLSAGSVLHLPGQEWCSAGSRYSINK